LDTRGFQAPCPGGVLSAPTHRRYQRNFGGQPVSAQWLDGAMSAVLPVEYASRPLVLIPPSQGDRRCAESGFYTDTLQCLRLALAHHPRPRPRWMDKSLQLEVHQPPRFASSFHPTCSGAAASSAALLSFGPAASAQRALCIFFAVCVRARASLPLGAGFGSAEGRSRCSKFVRFLHISRK
jgi:hypothetical protein